MKTLYYFLLIAIFYCSGCSKEEEKQQCRQNPTNTNFTGDAVYISYDSYWGKAQYKYTANVTNVCEYLTAQINITVTSPISDSVDVFGFVSVPGNSELNIPMSFEANGIITSGLYTLNPRQGNTNPTSYNVIVNISFPAKDPIDAVNKYTRFISSINITNNYYQPL